MNYFTTQSNNAQSCDQKIEIIQLICFLTQKKLKKFIKNFKKGVDKGISLW